MTKHHLNILGFFANVTWIYFAFKGDNLMWILLGCAAIIFLSILSVGIIQLQFNYFLTSINRTKNEKVLLTFDDGPHPTITHEILAILKKHNIGAFFFVIGKQAENQPQLINKIVTEGHKLCNHTQNHPLAFALKWQDTVDREIGYCDNTLIAQKQHPGHFFRPPIGYTNPRIARSVKTFKKQVVGWSLRSFDSVYKDEQQLLSRVEKLVKPSDIILFHDNLPQTSAMLEKFIIQAQKNGIKFASVEDLKTII